MSNKISRRSFMKGAGTAALAVAAAGVLAGCSNDSVIESVEKKEIRVVFALSNGQTVGEYKTMKVAKDASGIDASQIDKAIIPAGYSVVSTGNLKIENVAGKDTVTVIVKQDPTTKKITVKFYDKDKETFLTETATITVGIDATTVDTANVTPPAGYTVVGSQSSFISDGEIIVNVSENTKKVTVQYYYKTPFGNVDVTTGTVNVLQSKTVVEKKLLPEKITSGLLTYVIDDDRTSFDIINNTIRVKVKVKL
mgnify:CR=1 FL=1